MQSQPSMAINDDFRNRRSEYRVDLPTLNLTTGADREAPIPDANSIRDGDDLPPPAYVDRDTDADRSPIVGSAPGTADPDPRAGDFRGIGVQGTDGEAPRLTVSNAGGRTIIDGTAGDDDIRVSRLEGGGVRVSSGGQHVDLTDAQAQNLTIRAGDGNDRIRVDANVRYDLELDGGAGNDRIRGGRGNDTIRGGDGNDVIDGGRGDDVIDGGAGNDTIRGGAGHDYIEGGAGNDVIDGGAGNDVIYGLDGDDRIRGGRGNDYIDGGAGNDTLCGDAGNDILMGGRGDDRLYGGRGNDTLAGGEGTDRYDGGRGRDRIFRQAGERIDHRSRRDRVTEVDLSGPAPGANVQVVGSAGFQTRVQSDLDALRSIPEGRGLLGAIDATGRTVTIQETNGGNATGYTNPNARFMTGNNTANGAGTDSTIDYNPSLTNISGGHAWSRRPPVVGLYHEMVHGENAGRGSMPTGNTDGDRNRERIAVGLRIDEDSNPATPRTQPNRWTENGLREELGLARRSRY